MERSRKQNEDGVKSMKVEDGIGHVRRGREISMTGSGNVEENRESLRPLDLAGEASAKGAESSREIECRRKHSRGRREVHRPINTLIYDRHTERLDW
jgi:hypothetical protein